MQLPEEFKKFMRKKYFHHRSACKNPSAFTRMFYIQGYSGRFGEVRAACEAYIHDITQNVIITTKTVKNCCGDYEVTSISFKEGFVKPEPIEPSIPLEVIISDLCKMVNNKQDE